MESCEVTDHREPVVGAREIPRTVSAGGVVNTLAGVVGWLVGWLTVTPGSGDPVARCGFSGYNIAGFPPPSGRIFHLLG